MGTLIFPKNNLWTKGLVFWHKNIKARKVYSLKPSILVSTFYIVEKICVHKNILSLIVSIFFLN